MKTLKLFSFVLVVAISTSSLFAFDIVPDVPVKEIRTQVVELFSDAEFTIEEETVVNILFTFSSEGDIVILNIDSKNSDIKQYIAKQMNKKTIQTPGEPNRIFTLPLRITSS